LTIACLGEQRECMGIRLHWMHWGRGRDFMGGLSMGMRDGEGLPPGLSSPLLCTSPAPSYSPCGAALVLRPHSLLIKYSSR
jgi:hypothetical protein